MSVVLAAGVLRMLALKAGGTCSMEHLEARLTSLVGRDPIDRNASDVIEVVSRPGGGTVRIAGGAPRELEVASCDDLVEAVAVVASIWLREPVVEPPVRTGMALDALADAVVSDGQLGASLGVRATRGRWSLGVEVGRELAERVAAGDGAVEVAREDAVLVPCTRVGPIDACATVGARRIAGRGERLVGASEASSVTAVVGARAEWRVAVASRAWLRVFAGVDASAATATFRVDDMVVWTSPRLTVSAGAGVVVRIW